MSGMAERTATQLSCQESYRLANGIDGDHGEKQEAPANVEALLNQPMQALPKEQLDFDPDSWNLATFAACPQYRANHLATLR